MHRVSSAVVIILLAASAAASPTAAQVQPENPAAIKKPKIDLRGSQTTKQKQIVELAAEMIMQATKDSDFRTKLLDEKQLPLTGQRFRCSNGDTKELDRVRIWNIIAQGLERNTPKDYQMNFKVVLVPKNRPVVGSTALGKDPVSTAYWFINAATANNDAVSVARHLMHEWLHVAGFYHYPNNSARGDVPYAVGGLVRDVLKEESVRRQALVELRNRSLLDPADVAFLEMVVRAGQNEVIADMYDAADDDTLLGDETYPSTQQETNAQNAVMPEWCKSS